MITLDPSAAFPSVPTVERSVLSVLYNEPEKFDDAPNLTASHFHEGGRDVLFSVLQDEWIKNRSIDLSAIIERMRGDGTLDKVGGPAVFAELMSFENSSRHFEKHLQILNEHLSRRIAIRAALKLAEAAFTESAIEDVLAAAGEPISAIHDAVAEAKPPSSTKQLIKESLDRYMDRLKGIATNPPILTGIEEFDRVMRGLFLGRVYVFGAYPSGGKSLIGSQILIHTSQSGFPSLYVPLEMAEWDLVDRAVIQSTGAHALAWSEPKAYAAMHQRENPTEGEKAAFNKGVRKMLESTFVITKPANKRLQTIVAAVRKAHRTFGIKVAAIDFIQQIRVPEAKGNKEQTMEEISHTLQELAEELQIAVIVLSQLNADGDTKHGRVVEEDADAFLQVVQEMDKTKENFREHQHILIVKDRHFGNGGKKLELILDREKIRFVHGKPEKANTASRKSKANF